MKNYLDVLQRVVEQGRVKGNRTGVGTKYLFSEKFRHNMADGFPLLTTKKINPNQVVGELFGFLTGADTVQSFKEFGCNIWDAWGLKQEQYKLVLRSEDEYIEEYRDIIQNLSKNNVPVIFEIEHLSKLVGINVPTLYSMIFCSEKFYRSFEIAQKNGKNRTILC